ncbi:class I SAM-dependent DNA methyltransferase [Fictibacillus terranigra]|uniref:Class I SAM-dependent methyltransferase n=1 Tax=Fictibacillus terranigra TaxID=3058424 RepID=A0ABT8EA93_9BACL|nr:class I SAM-dependent methyltransferase [Fictibacillus sp. CENA-BCM004]MDN4074831.1 class I SAM-dependent methyltransferase [Fictibacillus sp. CENA-BCM004]
MSYQQFAYYYDQLMEDAPYNQWISFFEQAVQSYGSKVSNVLDLGCGTGSLSIRLSKQGYDVTGVDLSDDMLAIAKEKSIQQKVPVQYFQQDMTQLEGLQEFDAAVIFCDSLNYILTEDKVLAAFQSVYQHLKEDGLFLFDVHSLYKIHNIFMGSTFGSNEEQLSFIWQCFEGEEPDSIEHELSFFVQENENRYIRFDEVHIQRTFPTEVYKTMLESTGFQILAVSGDFTQDSIQPEAERIFFICKK